MPAPATSSCHLYTGHHRGNMQAVPRLKAHHLRHAAVPGPPTDPGFGATVVSHDASAVVHTRSSSRRLPDPLIAGLLRSRFPPRLLTGMTLRRFEISACTANPEDLPPSLAQHGSCWRPSTSPPLSFQDTRAPVFSAPNGAHDWAAGSPLRDHRADGPKLRSYYSELFGWTIIADNRSNA